MSEPLSEGTLEVARALGTEGEVVADLALSVAEPKTLDPNLPQALVVPLGAELQIPDLSEWRDRPQRRTGVYRPATVDSFIEYVGRQWIDGESTVWVHPSSGEVTAVVDDSGGPDAPGYRQHRVDLRLEHTTEWDYWAAKDGQLMSQVDFAEHIEDGLQEIEQPDAADLLELAQTFHAKTGVTFRSSTRLASGEQQLQYDEETAATAGRTGQMAVPTAIVLMLAPFIGEAEVQISARFRFRVNGGQLRLGYKLDQPHRVIRNALERVADRVSTQFPRTFIGEPPTAA